MMKDKSYGHLDYHARLKIEALYNQHATKKTIADEIGCSLSTIYREIPRGLYERYGKDLATITAYSADIAQQDHDYKATAKGSSLKLNNDFKFAKFIESTILNDYSPAAALAMIGQKNLSFDTHVCIKTLYNYIHSDVFIGLSMQDLPRHGKVTTSHKTIVRNNVKNPLATSIDERPKEVNERVTFGHWEMDTVVGKSKGAGEVLLVLTERLTRNEIIKKIPGRTQESVKNALDNLENELGNRFKYIFKTITVDNGSEFLDASKLEKSCSTNDLRTKVYFCHPYSSWERGSNENANGLIRRKIPKSTPLENYSDEDIAYFEYWLNTYPRKILGFNCAHNLYQKYLCELDL